MGMLSLLLWTPALGVLLLAVIPSGNTLFFRILAIGFSTVCLALVTALLTQFDPAIGRPQFSEHFPLNPLLGSAYALGIDGLSMPLLLLTCLLVTVSLLMSYTVKAGIKGYYICILLLEFGLFGVFLAQDWALFFLFWQLTLIPLFFLINRWGDHLRRHTASLRFIIYLMGGSVFLLISLMAMSQFDWQLSGSMMASLKQTASDMPQDAQILVLLGFFLGFGVNMAIFPLHGWLPLAQTAVPGAVNILISGVFLNMGAYGLARAIAMLPAAAHALQPLILLLALFGMVYGGLLAWRQTELKPLLAYWTVGQMAVVALAIASLNNTGLYAAILQLAAHGLIAATLFLLADALYRQTSVRNLFACHPVRKALPKFSVLMSLALLAAMAIPGSAGFIAIIHALIGTTNQHPAVTAIFLVAGLITATYLIRTINQLFLGPIEEHPQQLNDLMPLELSLACGLVLAIFLMGFVPAPWLNLSSGTIKQISASLHTSLL